MSDSRSPIRNSSHSRQLPPIDGFRGNVGNLSHVRRMSMHEDYGDETPQSLRQQIEVRDHVIASLRSEKGRIQAMCERFETKSQVMDREIAALVEEKTELRHQVSALAAQVEALSRDKEALQNQSQADAAQWRQIMSMSSKLQMQSVEETRRFNAAKEEWSRERKDLEARINNTQLGGVLQRIDTSEGSDAGPLLDPPQLTPNFAATSQEQLQVEINSARGRCQELEGILASLVKESSSIERTSRMLKEVRKRLGGSSELPDDTERKRVRS